MEVIAALAVLVAVCIVLAAFFVALVLAVEEASWRMARRRIRQRRRGGFVL